MRPEKSSTLLSSNNWLEPVVVFSANNLFLYEFPNVPTVPNTSSRNKVSPSFWIALRLRNDEPSPEALRIMSRVGLPRYSVPPLVQSLDQTSIPLLLSDTA